MTKKIIGLVFIFLLVLALYFPVFNTYFTSDDFFHFKASLTDGSFLGFLKLFGVYPIMKRGYAFYRPLFREVLYNISYNLWGLNQLPLRIFSILIHFVNITLVYIFIEKITKDKRIAFFTSLMFGVSAANIGILYYLAGGIQAQGATLFVLLTLILFPKHKALAFASFVLSLMSHEMALVTPMLLCGLMFLNKNFKIKYVLPYFLLAAIFVFIELKVIGFSSQELQYRPSLNPIKALNTLGWYGLWAYGVPETLIDYIGPGIRLNPNLMRYYGDYYKFIIPAFLISVISFLVVIRSWSLKIDRKFLFFVFWFVVGILPVVLLPMHKSTYYLSISLAAFWGGLFYLIFKNKKTILIPTLVFAISLIVFTLFTVKVGSITYWAAERGIVSRKLINNLVKVYPTLPKGAVLFMKNDPSYPFISTDWGGTSKQASLTLSGADAIQLLYRDPTIKVYYEDLSQRPNANVYEFMVRLQ